MEEFEKRLQDHAKIAKSTVAAPFNIESEEIIMSNRKKIIKRTALIAAAAVCIIATTTFAAYRYLSAKDFANKIGDHSLARYFDDSEIASETVTDGKYKATLLGIVSGENLSSFELDSRPDRTYAVVAVEKTDGSEMTYDDDICVSPLVQGLKPWQFNIVFMQGGYTALIENGILYRMIECDNIEYFADKQIYLAVTDMTFIDNQPFAFDENTGLISANENYDGTNILFNLELDKSKADPEKAAEYLKSLENEDEDSPDADSPDESADSEGIRESITFEITKDMSENI